MPFKLLPIALITALLVSGCARTMQARSVTTTGFLEDYTVLSKNQSDQALLSFWKDNAEWQNYRKIILEPVKIIKTPESELNELGHAQLFKLKQLFDYRLRSTLKKDFTLVKVPAPDVLRIEFAITEAETSNVLLDTFSTFYPSARVLSGLKWVFTGTEFYVGKASIEGKITDAMTGDLLMASADRRTGGKTLIGATNDWDDVEQAFIFWAQHLNSQLCQKQGHLNCPILE